MFRVFHDDLCSPVAYHCFLMKIQLMCVPLFAFTLGMACANTVPAGRPIVGGGGTIGVSIFSTKHTHPHEPHRRSVLKYLSLSAH